jgi:alpha-L-fucosidase
MKYISLLFAWIFIIHLSSFGQTGHPAAEKKQIDRFFGIHMDFHATAQSDEVGKTLSDAMVNGMLTLVKPDFLQVDCKGHPGYTSYPTTVGTPAPGIIKDPLRIFRNATTAHHVPLFVHYSGVQDHRAVELHPDWANTNARQEKDKSNTSLFGPYVDELMIPQLKELITKYKIDGAWIDGDCWSAQADYGAAALEAFRKETGISTVPVHPKDEGYLEFMDFNRRQFRKYVGHYVDAIHQFDPSFLITSNWSYSSMMPEKVDVQVDYLSGDMSSVNGVNNAAFEARCLAPQGKPWDLMAWGFTHNWKDQTDSYKSAIQLDQEAAQVLSMGGGFQIYYPQNSDGSIKSWKTGTMADVAEFCRARKSYTYRAQAVPQIALLHSTEGFKHTVRGLYNNGNGIFDEEQGILRALLDGQHCVEILMEHSLREKLQQYRTVIIPGWSYLAPEFIEELREYVTAGGNLIVAGSKAVKLFEKDLGVDFGKYEEKKRSNLGYGHDMASIITDLQEVKLQESTNAVGNFYEQTDLRWPEGIPASVHQMGKGKIAAIYFNVGENYLKHQAPVFREFLSAVINDIFPDPLLRVQGSHLVNVGLNRIGKNYAVNLVNVSGPHANADVYVYDEILPVGPLKISCMLTKKPSSITLQPGNRVVPFRYEHGVASFVVDSLKIYSIAIVKP